MAISFIKTDRGDLTLFFGGKTYNVAADHPNYNKIRDALKASDEKALVKLIDVVSTVNKYTGKAVEIVAGVVYYKGNPMHNVVAQRILQLMTEGFPFQNFVNFLENVMQNPSSRAVDELFTFLMNQNLPVTEDGHFLAYKRVQDNWMDIYSGKIDNSIGKIVTMERNLVDDDFRQHCSRGLHVGAISYVHGYGSGGHIVICKVNPADVVSVPDDCNFTKLRTCRYEVMYEYTGDLTEALYSAKGGPAARNLDNDDDSYEDGQVHSYSSCGGDEDDDCDDDDDYYDDDDDCDDIF